jgi:hypothetical protein
LQQKDIKRRAYAASLTLLSGKESSARQVGRTAPKHIQKKGKDDWLQSGKKGLQNPPDDLAGVPRAELEPRRKGQKQARDHEDNLPRRGNDNLSRQKESEVGRIRAWAVPQINDAIPSQVLEHRRKRQKQSRMCEDDLSRRTELEVGRNRAWDVSQYVEALPRSDRDPPRQAWVSTERERPGPSKRSGHPGREDSGDWDQGRPPWKEHGAGDDVHTGKAVRREADLSEEEEIVGLVQRRRHGREQNSYDDAHMHDPLRRKTELGGADEMLGGDRRLSFAREHRPRNDVSRHEPRCVIARACPLSPKFISRIVCMGAVRGGRVYFGIFL